MDDKTLSALTALAQKLGTTAEYLWGVLLKQAPITGAVDLVLMAGLALGAVLWFRFVRAKTTRPARTDENKHPGAQWEGEAAFFGFLSAFLAALFVAIMICGSLSTTVAALVNPEYWALKQILK